MSASGPSGPHVFRFLISRPLELIIRDSVFVFLLKVYNFVNGQNMKHVQMFAHVSYFVHFLRL